MKSPEFPCWLVVIFAAAFLNQTAGAVVLTINQTAQYAFAAGFRGGSLVSAIAAAEAESGFDTEAVNNNVHLTTAGGTLLPGLDGRPVLLSLPRPSREMLPLDSIQPLDDGRYGKVVSHCRGLWQFNNRVHSRTPTDAQAFDPTAAAACALKVSRHGRDWGKWVAMQNGTAWQSARLARARTAAIALDFSVLRGTVNERVQARVTAGSIRATPAGARIRALHFADTGRALAGPVLAAITQGKQTSTKLWWQVQWDSGPTGWVSEDLLIRSSGLDLQPALPVYDGWPHNITGVMPDATLTWCTGANTTTQKVYLGTSPTPGAADLKFTGLINEWRPAAPLTSFTTYYWRVDTISAQGAVLPGPVWYFLTRPPAPAAVTLESVVTSPPLPQPGFNFVITCHTRSPSGQAVLVRASLHRINTTPLDDPPNDVPRFAPAGAGSFTRNFNLPLTTPQGSYTMLVRLVQDYNGNGTIEAFETVITEKRIPLLVPPPGPLVDGLVVSPATMAPGQQATITASISALPGSSLGQLKLFRAEGETAPGPWTLVQTWNMNNAGQYGASFTDRPPSIRRYWYAVQAFDNTGRGAPDGPYFHPVSVRVTINDHHPPVFTWAAPADGAAIALNAMIQGSMADNDLIETASYNMDDGGWEPLGTNGWFIWPAAGAGPHNITIRATDRSGNTVQEKRLYYVIPQPGGTDFDEDQAFTTTSGHHPYWSLGVEGAAAIMNGRTEAPGAGDSATLNRFKRPPAWAHSLEVSYQCGPAGGSMTWDRDFFPRLLVRVVRTGTGQWQLHAGQLSVYQTIPLNLTSMAPEARLSVLARISEGTLYCRVVTADANANTLADSLQSLPNLSLPALGSCTFQTEGNDSGTGWLDDLSFRALRAENALRCRDVLAFQPVGGQRNFRVDWTSVPGSTYQMEVTDPITGQWARTGAPVVAQGISTRQTLVFPTARKAALLRVRHVLP